MTKKGINNLLKIMVVGLAVIIMFKGGILPTIWNGFVLIVQDIFPSWWKLLAYAYVGTMCFLLGVKAGMKNKEK